MKTVIKSKLAFAFVIAGLAISCKNNEAAPADNNIQTDSTEIAVDTISPNADTTNINSGTTGTTGATGEGSTGSGSAGTTEKGNNVTPEGSSTGNNNE